MQRIKKEKKIGYSRARNRNIDLQKKLEGLFTKKY